MFKLFLCFLVHLICEINPSSYYESKTIVLNIFIRFEFHNFIADFPILNDTCTLCIL